MFAVSINPENLKARLKMGRIFLMAKKTKEAMEKALKISPNFKGADDAHSIPDK